MNKRRRPLLCPRSRQRAEFLRAPGRGPEDESLGLGEARQGGRLEAAPSTQQPPLCAPGRVRTALLAASKSAPPGAARESGELDPGPHRQAQAQALGAPPGARSKQAAARARSPAGTQARAGGAAALKSPPHESAPRRAPPAAPVSPRAELRCELSLHPHSRGRAPQPPLLHGRLGTPTPRAQASRDTHPGEHPRFRAPRDPLYTRAASSGAGKGRDGRTRAGGAPHRAARSQYRLRGFLRPPAPGRRQRGRRTSRETTVHARKEPLKLIN